MKNIYFTLLFTLLFVVQLSAQKLEWATSVEGSYNFATDAHGWNVETILGSPDSEMRVSGSEATRLIKEAAYGTITLSFENIISRGHIVIVENYLPGRISEVIAIDTEGVEHIEYQIAPKLLLEEYRLLFIPLKGTYSIKSVKITMNTLAQSGWSQIDAVGLTSQDDINKIKTELNNSYGFEFIRDRDFASVRQNMGRNINTRANDIKPAISPSGDELYFHRVHYDGNVGKRKDPQDIYVSKLVNDKWTYAENLGSPLNDKAANGVSSISPDGKRILVTRRKGKKETVSISRRNSQGWSKPQKLIIRDFHNTQKSADYFLSRDEEVLLVAMHGLDSRGGVDQYVCFKESNGIYSKPLNMGENINSFKNDFGPFLAADNKTLYFSSDGHSGYGQSDIFFTKRLDDTWQNWSTPKNLGLEVNSNNWEGYYTISAKGDYAYFVSKQGELDGSLDIFKILLAEEFRPEPSVLITGKVYDAETNFPIQTQIKYEALSGESTNGGVESDQDGDYVMLMSGGNNYGFRAVADGYIGINENLDLRGVEIFQEFKKDLYLVPVESGKVLRLNNIFFQRGKADLLPESFPELQRLAEVIRQSPTMIIELGGHTDGVGSPRLNMELSLNRVVAVRQYLVQTEGIDGRRVLTKAYGGTDPIAPNDVEENRKKNRRVDVKILKK